MGIEPTTFRLPARSHLHGTLSLAGVDFLTVAPQTQWMHYFAESTSFKQTVPIPINCAHFVFYNVNPSLEGHIGVVFFRVTTTEKDYLSSEKRKEYGEACK